MNSCCSTSSLMFSGVIILDFGHFNGYIVVSHCCFNLYFPGGIMWSIFSWAYLAFAYLFWWGVCSGFWSIFNKAMLLLLNFKSFFCKFGYPSFIKCDSCKFFLPVCGLSSHSPECVRACMRACVCLNEFMDTSRSGVCAWLIPWRITN